jgi:ATP-dependent RNA helicase DOB1
MVRGQPSKPLDAKASEEHIVFILLNCAVNGRVDARDKSGGAIQTIQPAGDGPGEPVVVPVLLSCIESFSVVRMHIGRDLKSLPARQEAYSRVKLLMSQRNGKVPVLDPIANMGIKDEGFLKLVKVREALDILLPYAQFDAFRRYLQRIGTYESKLQALPISASPDLERLYNEYSDYVDLKESIRATKRKITQVQNVLQMEELKNRQRVLRRLGFTSADDVLSEKARVACEISTGDELLLTEMIFSGAFNDLSPAHCAAVLVCFVFDEKVSPEARIHFCNHSADGLPTFQTKQLYRAKPSPSFRTKWRPPSEHSKNKPRPLRRFRSNRDYPSFPTNTSVRSNRN